ncbi:MAG TPA: cupin domain-containing protein [Planctomycetota bacterium]|nr:cupin domain-containing protein [Planctomycetota bacterium]
MRFAFALLLAGCAAPRMATESMVTNMPDLVRMDPVGETPAKITLLHGDDVHTCNVVQVRAAVKAHVHRKSHEIVCVVSGEGRLKLGDKELRVGPGDVIFVARGTVHAFESTGAEPAVVLSVFTPRFVEGDRIFVQD